MRFKILTILFLLLFLCVAIYFAVTQIDYIKSDSINAAMEKKIKETPESGLNKNEENEILPKYAKLYEENQEFVGWIQIEGTEMNYPVMNPKADSNFYLTHGPDGSNNQLGAIYVAASGEIDDPSTNIILYGHNFRDGSMFGSLKNYKKENYYSEHPVIRFDTIYEEGNYEIISVFTSKVYREDENVFKYDQYTNFQSKEEFNTYLTNIKNLSLYEINETAEYGDALITLSTSDSWTENGRIAVVAKKSK